jgi:MFS transporter, NRE family, putaive nickel resistance protein
MAFPIPSIFQVLKNSSFAQLYFAQAINLVGDACTWLGLALLAVDLAGKNAGGVLSIALTLRVLSFVLLSPIAGSIADRYDRKWIMVITHLGRMVLVCGLPFVTQVWQLYGIVLLLNCFAAFFTPTYKACIPLVTTDAEMPQAIALTGSTYQMLVIIGPGLAGALAMVGGQRQIFFWDGLTFLMAAIGIFTLPRQLRIGPSQLSPHSMVGILHDIKLGMIPLFQDKALRYGLATQLIGAIVGAQILVNTVGYVETTLHLGPMEYSWVMLVWGLGAAIGSIAFNYLSDKIGYLRLAGTGGIMMALALLPANTANLSGLIGLWLLAGIGQAWIDLPMQTLVGMRVDRELQGRVYGAHFAWSHLWWAIGYPLAGFLGQQWPQSTFTVSGWLAVGLIVGLRWWLWPKTLATTGFWHEHQHAHGEDHNHHGQNDPHLPHSHLHYHEIMNRVAHPNS